MSDEELKWTATKAASDSGMRGQSQPSDGLHNTVEVGKRDSAGPLGGEIKGLRKAYDDLLRSVMADDAIRYRFLG